MPVKGTKQVRMVVVPHRPLRTALIRVISLLVFLGGVLAAYYYGHYQAVQLNGDAVAERDRFRSEVESARGQLETLRQELASSQQSSAMDRQALENMQVTVVDLREKIAELEEDVALYRQILSPEEAAEAGLVVGRLDLAVVGTGGTQLKYRLELTRAGREDGRVEGYVNMEIAGISGEQEVRLPLHTLTQDETAADIRLGFRYFQNVEGELSLPEGFVPVSVEVRAVEQGGETEKVVEKSFPWQVEGL